MEETAKKRRRIQVGLLVSHLDDEFDSAVCEGAIEGARQMDANLVIFPGRYIDGFYADKLRTEYEYQYNTIFDLPIYSKFDVLLVLIGTIGSHLDSRKKQEFLQRFEGTPVITVTSSVPGYPCIRVDNRSGMEAVVQHLITEHGCTRIGFMSGPITNDDALDRLEVYRNVLQRNDIVYDEKLVAYGNFSRFVGPKVEQLLDDNPDIQAIVFANDQMAFAGYEVLKKRGIRVGQDILITGFDDDPVAQDVTPKMTTVRSDTTALGHDAVVEAVNYVTMGLIEKSLLQTSMVLRNSCGCSGNPLLTELTSKVTRSGPQAYSEIISDFLLIKGRDSAISYNIRREVYEVVNAFDMIVHNGELHRAEARENVVSLVEHTIGPEFLSYVTSENLYIILEYGYRTLLSTLSTDEEKVLLSELFMQIHSTIAQKNLVRTKRHLENDHFMNWQTNSITRDMLVYDFYDDQSYLSVIDKLQRLHMASSYLYTFEPAVVNHKNDNWQFPKTLHLKAWHNQSEAVLVPVGQQQVRREELFSNAYMPQDRQYSMVAVPLFSKEEHYGILMCEIEHKYFHYIQASTFQLCAALRILSLMKQQSVTQRQLRKSLIEVREINQLLSEESKTDDMTGCLNRRGFYEEMRHRLREVETNSDAIMVFADLDSLKLINDRHGHAEGDFAIRTVAEILREAMGEEAILSRLGGDEFVACAFLRQPASIKQILDHIESVTENCNAMRMQSKDYLVHISVGVYPFRCTDTTEIGELLSHADALLYERKKRKKDIFKM